METNTFKDLLPEDLRNCEASPVVWAYIADLLAKVSEQQKEIERLKNALEKIDGYAKNVRPLKVIHDIITEARQMKQVKVKLTKYEVEILLLAAGNGYGDGEFFCDSDGCDTGYGGKRADAAYVRVAEKLKAGINIISNDEEVSEQSQMIQELVEALKSVFELIDTGVLVRDISRDNEPGWAVKQLPMLVSLGKAKSLLSKFEVPNQS